MELPPPTFNNAFANKLLLGGMGSALNLKVGSLSTIDVDTCILAKLTFCHFGNFVNLIFFDTSAILTFGQLRFVGSKAVLIF